MNFIFQEQMVILICHDRFDSVFTSFASATLLPRSFRLRLRLVRFGCVCALFASATLSDQGHSPVNSTIVFGFAQTWKNSMKMISSLFISLLSVVETIFTIIKRMLLVVERSRNEQR
jgi:hypothetical protein